MRGRNVRRLFLWAFALCLSSGALLLSAANVNAGDWHYQWGSTPVVQPGNSSHAYGSCPYIMPAGQPSNHASVGVHWNHSWVELTDWRGSLGYSPGALTYYTCKNSASAVTALSSPMFDLWSVAQPNDPTNTSYRANSPDYYCPSSHPLIVGAYCQTRVWW